MAKVVEIAGLNNVLEMIDQLFADLQRVLLDVSDAALSNLQDHFTYPPASEANRPKYGAYGPYYNRGVGSAYKRKKDGQVTQRLNSERLGASWVRNVRKRTNSIEATLGNKASYGPYVHSKAKQAPFHGRRGWQTVEDALDAEKDGIVDLYGAVISDFLGKGATP